MNYLDCKINFTNYVRFSICSNTRTFEEISRKAKNNEIKQNQKLSMLVEDKLTNTNHKKENLNKISTKI